MRYRGEAGVVSRKEQLRYRGEGRRYIAEMIGEVYKREQEIYRGGSK